jgi:hypothetical protein
MTSSEFVPLLEAYIKTQEDIAGQWDGDTPRGEEKAMTAAERMEAAQALLAVITEYDL